MSDPHNLLVHIMAISEERVSGITRWFTAELVQQTELPCSTADREKIFASLRSIMLDAETLALEARRMAEKYYPARMDEEER